MSIKRVMSLIVLVLITWLLQFIGIMIVDDVEAFRPYSVSEVERRNT